jgi:hypothetical protein
LGISQWLSYTLLAVLSACPTAFKSIPSGYRLKHGNFQPFSLKGRISVNISENSEQPLKIFKTTSGSSSRTDLSNKKNWSQSLFHATVPLKDIRDTLSARCKPIGRSMFCLVKSIAQHVSA